MLGRMLLDPLLLLLVHAQVVEHTGGRVPHRQGVERRSSVVLSERVGAVLVICGEDQPALHVREELTVVQHVEPAPVVLSLRERDGLRALHLTR